MPFLSSRPNVRRALPAMAANRHLIMTVNDTRSRPTGMPIGTPLRVERRLDRGNFGPKSGEHLGNHGIGPDEHPMRFDRRGHVPVAEVPGKAGR